MTTEQEEEKNRKDKEDKIQKEFGPEEPAEEGVAEESTEEEIAEELAPLAEMGEGEPVLGATEELAAEPEHEPEPEPEPAPETEPEDITPAYMLENPPEGKTNYIKWGLLHGMEEEYLKQEGYNVRSIDICAQELEKAGLRKRPKKPSTASAVAKATNRSAQIFAKGSPPEALIEALEIPGIDGKLAGFDQGMRFGASVIVLGVRIVQELSALGVQQTKPLIDVANSMRQGEALAAKNAAGEAAFEAAAAVQQSMLPTLQALQKGAEGPDPMKAMMVRTMEPMMQNLMKTVIPGMPQGETIGWTRKQTS